jgi:hypothetical protein
MMVSVNASGHVTLLLYVIKKFENMALPEYSAGHVTLLKA